MQVHHLIEECIIFNMSKEECMEALSKHANIKPVITSTGQSPFLYIISQKALTPKFLSYMKTYMYTYIVPLVYIFVEI